MLLPILRPLLRVLAASGLAALACGAQAPLRLEAREATLKLGLLAQPMFETLGSATREGTAQNLFLRRFRLLAGGTFGDDFEFFFETDNPNLGKADLSGAKTTAGLILQDAVITYKFLPTLRLDAGYILVPGSHHGTQGATTLLATDYSPYTFLQSAPLGNSNGRDGGLQLRGSLGHLEFRVGAFQGKRLAETSATATTPAVASRNALRLAGRAQWNFFEGENGLFLAGTYLGARRILSLGLAHDRQDDYRSTALDAFLDWPLGGDGVTFQVNRVKWDGGTWLTALPAQRTTFAEGAYRFGSLQLSPLVRFDQRRPDRPTAALPEEDRLGAGLAWWFKGHASNLKALYVHVRPSAPGVTTLKAYDQVNLQWQVYLY